LGFNYYAGAAGFLGVGAPPGLPEEIRKKLEDAFRMAINTPEFKKTIESLSLEVWFQVLNSKNPRKKD
jgi:tripartite-type tricarboxylate transporter receptor subunit TctC